MEATLFKQVGYSLSKLIADIDMGEIGLPDIQRPFIWNATKVRDLFDSMYKGFPVGYLLFWINGLDSGHRQIGADAKQNIPRLLIVDGQQRLTSLYAVLKRKQVVGEDYVPRHIQIAFRPRDAKFEVTDAAIKRDPEFITDISQLWSTENPRTRFVKEFISKLKAHRPLEESEEDQLAESIDRLYDLQHYPFTALELTQGIDEEKVAEIFVRINSKGITLNQADFILTLMSVFWDEGRSQLEQFCRSAKQPSTSEASPFNYFIEPHPDQLLRVSVGLGFHRARLQHVYSILRGKDLETEQFSEERRIKQFELLKDAQAKVLDLQNWHEFLKSLICAGFKGSSMISSNTNLLYGYIMFLMGKCEYRIDLYKLRNAIARWFFMTSMTARYSASPETAMEADLAALRQVTDGNEFISVLDRIIEETLTDDYWNITLPNELATSAARSPVLSAYYASLILLGARVLFSKLKVAELIEPSLKAKKSGIERHHLFPRGYLNSIGIAELIDINQIANYAFVEWYDNVDISDKSPAEYFPKYAKRANDEDWPKLKYWHALPDEWEHMKYKDFLEARRLEIAKVIRDGFIKLRGLAI
jgi:hypothetical protein